MKTRFYIVVIVILSLATQMMGQDEPEEKEKIQHNRIALFTGYTLVSTAVDVDTTTGVLVAPTLGITYEYYFSEKFALGLVNAVELDSYKIETHEGDFLEREYSFRSALVFVYEPFEFWSLYAGGGYEFESHEGFPLIKIGTDLTKKFEEGWDVSLTIDYDIKAENSSPAIGVSVGKKLGKFR